MTEKKVYILYGSQTGNAESIAKELCDKLEEESFPVKCAALNTVKGLKLQDDCLFLTIICSTTGNGDCPENGDSWWRSVKLRSTAKDFFSGIDFAVLGLGDTNYDKFCHMGKSIDKRIGELGGNRVLPLECADEATDLEDTVEAWKLKFFAFVKALQQQQQQCIVPPQPPSTADEISATLSEKLNIEEEEKLAPE